MMGGDRRSRACGGPGGIKDLVLETLNANPERTYTADEMTKLLKVKRGSAEAGLTALARESRAVRVGRGVYQAVRT